MNIFSRRSKRPKRNFRNRITGKTLSTRNYMSVNRGLYDPLDDLGNIILWAAFLSDIGESEDGNESYGDSSDYYPEETYGGHASESIPDETGLNPEPTPVRETESFDSSPSESSSGWGSSDSSNSSSFDSGSSVGFD